MTRVFISYSHSDEPLRAELDKHLALLKRQGALDIWSDHRILPGGEIDASISEGLESADLILLLISADFIASDYCFGVEINRAIERQVSGDCVVVPVILRPCDWRSAPFGGLKAIPTDGRAITKWPSKGDAFEDIVKHVRTILAKPGRSESPTPAALATTTAQLLAGAPPTLTRVSGAFSTNGIACSSNESASGNSFHESLSVEVDKQALYFKAMMGMFNRASESKQSEEGAAEHL